ncbi:MAG: HlyD family efflux transporter periplasmic adaptor subunit [Planctomycetota bacterium]
MPQRRAIIKTILLVGLFLCASAIASVMLFQNVSPSAASMDSMLTFEVFQGEFVASVNEAGDIESSVNTEIRCEVKSKGSPGTAILEIIEEGTMVQEGDFIGQLDDSVLNDELTLQRIAVAEDKAALIQAESDWDTAKRVLQEYENGLYEQEVARLRAEVATAEEAVRRAAEFRRHSETLSRKGYRTKTQLEADQFAEEKAELDLDLARQNLTVYQDFTRERIVAEFKAEINKQEANVEATRYTVELSLNREKELEQEVANCRIVAPRDGMVVYANETDRRGDSSFVIEEGALIRDGQPIVRLPDPNQMQVRTKVNDSKINRVAVGDRCLVRVDTDPERPVQGRVRRISSFPLPRRWYQAPIEYEVFVEITEKSDLIRPGLRGKVEIFTEQIDKCLQAPMSSLVKRDERYFVFVKQDREIEAREVEVGVNNDKFIVITGGLRSGESVLVDADTFEQDFLFSSTNP